MIGVIFSPSFNRSGAFERAEDRNIASCQQLRLLGHKQFASEYILSITLNENAYNVSAASLSLVSCCLRVLILMLVFFYYFNITHERTGVLVNTDGSYGSSKCANLDILNIDQQTEVHCFAHLRPIALSPNQSLEHCTDFDQRRSVLKGLFQAQGLSMRS